VILSCLTHNLVNILTMLSWLIEQNGTRNNTKSTLQLWQVHHPIGTLASILYASFTCNFHPTRPPSAPTHLRFEIVTTSLPRTSVFSITDFAAADDDHDYFNGSHSKYVQMCSLQVGSFCFSNVLIFQTKKIYFGTLPCPTGCPQIHLYLL
jgi:hypothetical protein